MADLVMKEKLSVWLIKEGEPLPVTEDVELMRTGSLAKYLAEHGYEVTWWTSTFSHVEKKYLYKNYAIINVRKTEKLVFLHSPIAYKRNVSISKIIYAYILSKLFSIKSRRFPKPDIIICSWPLPGFAKEAVKYGKRHSVPVVIDVLDQWPDIFDRAFPPGLRGLARLVLFPLKRSAKKTLEKADGITAMMPKLLQWGCCYAGREPGAHDKNIPIGNDNSFQEFAIKFESNIVNKDFESYIQHLIKEC